MALTTHKRWVSCTPGQWAHYCQFIRRGGCTYIFMHNGQVPIFTLPALGRDLCDASRSRESQLHGKHGNRAHR